MRVVPGLIKDGEIQVFIEVREDADTLEIAGLEKVDTVDAEEADDEGAADAGDEAEPEHDKKDGDEEEDEDEDEDDKDKDDEDEDDEDDDEDEDEAAVSRLEGVADAVAAVCGTLYQRLQETLDDEAPSEFRIEFGITLAGRDGIPVVSQGDTPASFKVTVKWENG